MDVGQLAAMRKQTRTRGPGWPISNAWKRETQAEMKRQGITPADMARRIKCAPPALNTLFQKRTMQSRLVPAIHKVLGRPAPSTVVPFDERLRRLVDRWWMLTKDQRLLVLGLVEQMVANRPCSHQNPIDGEPIRSACYALQRLTDLNERNQASYDPNAGSVRSSRRHR
jgi:hypothetical protein